jgi:hypothetical protein
VLTPLPARPENASYHTRFQGTQAVLAAAVLAAAVLAALAGRGAGADRGADAIPVRSVTTHTWAMSAVSTAPHDGTARHDGAVTDYPPGRSGPAGESGVTCLKV